jgi:Bacteriocin-protection, YdeI or OmpD-Associated/Domain of unknown function (DUF1905)
VRFKGRLETRGRGHVVRLPFDVREELGAVRAPVRVAINGRAFHTTTMRYGGVDYIGLNRDVREAAGVRPGNTFRVELEHDAQPREVDVPAELERALAKDTTAKASFERLSYTHRKEYARWVAEAKRAETRARRLETALAMLREGAPTPR